MRDAPCPLRALEDRRRVVAPLDRLREASVEERLGPLLEQVDVVREIHDIDGASARGARADLAEHHLAVVAPVPLHVREPVAESECPQHVAAHGATARELGCVDVAHDHGHRADPLQLARDQRVAAGTRRCCRRAPRRLRRWCRTCTRSASTNSSTLTSSTHTSFGSTCVESPLRCRRGTCRLILRPRSA